LGVVVPPREADGEPMIESIAVQYRAQAERYHALADQTDCLAREALYRRLERGYLTLADLSRPPRAKSAARTVKPANLCRPAFSPPHRWRDFD
jgi:hypothetical protein